MSGRRSFHISSLPGVRCCFAWECHAVPLGVCSCTHTDALLALSLLGMKGNIPQQSKTRVKEQESLGHHPWSVIPAPLKSCVLPTPFSPSMLWLIQLLNIQSLPTSQAQKEFTSLAPSWHKDVCCGQLQCGRRKKEGRSQAPT